MIQKYNMPEIWGGIECTINRVNENYTDQLKFAGYYSNPAQLDAIINLDIKTLRFPVLWEKHEPLAGIEIDWSFTRMQLDKLRANNIIPIAGLLHHGSGPRFTHLLKKDFPETFAAYAAKVAKEFPWITLYTPVNEPLTTARFSGLYGLWYPHTKNDVSFVRILLNELKATVLAMQEIKKINPAAKLVQTEDLGKTYSTPLLAYQAAFENKRRWLTYDILCGKFNNQHPLWNYFIRLGIEPADMQFFLDNVCPPDIIGVNYYVTSERYLDDKIENYAGELAGGNSLHQYADVEAVRVELNEPHGLEFLLTEIWQRYKLPLAITEVHLHCSREEQIRWFNEVYKTAVKAKNDGVDLRAITSWALLGSFGWNKLLTGETFEYESGAFDISAGYARPTALAMQIQRLTKQQAFNSHVLSQPGWWKKGKAADNVDSTFKPLVIFGKTGTLGQAFAKICKQRSIPFILLNRAQADICNAAQLEAIVKKYDPWALINTCGYVNIDEAELNKEQCYRENYLGPQVLAIICQKLKLKLLTFSTDQVFNGLSKEPYTESHATDPLNIYGHSKQLAENVLLKDNPSSLIIRTSTFFGPWDKYNFLSKMLTCTSAGKCFPVSNALTVSPTYLPHLVHSALDLLIDNESGIWHLTNSGHTTFYMWARHVAEKMGTDPELIIPLNEPGTIAARPLFSVLSSEKYGRMPSLAEGNNHFIAHHQAINKTKHVKNNYESV